MSLTPTLGDQPEGYWEWYRTDGTIKRSGHFEKGNPVGECTYDSKGEKYKTTNRDKFFETESLGYAKLFCGLGNYKI